MTGIPGVLAALAVLWTGLTLPTGLTRLITDSRTTVDHTTTGRGFSTRGGGLTEASIAGRRPPARARAPPGREAFADERGEPRHHPANPRPEQEATSTDDHGFAAHVCHDPEEHTQPKTRREGESDDKPEVKQLTFTPFPGEEFR
jgi:hypothetical protein